MSEWANHTTIPKLDGSYYTRLNNQDDEPLFVYVREGKAYRENGSERMFINCEWKKVSL
jgi:hypothetical protein